MSGSLGHRITEGTPVKSSIIGPAATTGELCGLLQIVGE
jgi:hypothetical protein